MRRIIVLGLILLLAFSTFCLAEEADSSTQSYQDMIESLDYESLLALSVAVNTELVSRPEALPLVLSKGMYLVGSDIAPGIYYFTSPDPAQYTAGYIFSSKTTFENRAGSSNSPGFVCDFDYLEVGETERIILESGNLISVTYPVVLCTDKVSAENYFTYTPPEGTYVPAGIYTVGADIPEGMYRFYSATGYEVTIRITESGKLVEKLEPTTKYETARLLDGYEIETNSDIIMTKQPSLSFE